MVAQLPLKQPGVGSTPTASANLIRKCLNRMEQFGIMTKKDLG